LEALPPELVFPVFVRRCDKLENIDRGFIEETRAEDMVICKNICPGARKVYSLILYIRK